MTSANPYLPIIDELTATTATLRETLRDAIRESSIGDAVLTSRAIGDRLGIDKTLAWAVQRMATMHDVAASLGCLPGRRAWTKIIRGLRQAGTSHATLDRIEQAVDALRARLESRGIDREMLRVIAAGTLDSAEEQRRHLNLRRRFFDAARLMWGVSAEGVVVAHLLSPNAKDPDLVDCTGMQVVHGLERHRAGPPWTFYYSQFTHDGHGGDQRRNADPLDAEATGPMLEDLSSPGVLGSEILSARHGEVDVFEFADRAPGRRGPLRAVFAERTPAAGSRFGSEQDDRVVLVYADALPMAMCVFDVIVHRDLEGLGTPEPYLAASVDRNTALRYRLRLADQLRLPLGSVGNTEALREELRERSRSLPAPLDGCARVYRDLIRRAAAAVGATPEEFTIHRMVVPHPPIPSQIVATLSLPTRPASAPPKRRRTRRAST